MAPPSTSSTAKSAALDEYCYYCFEVINASLKRTGSDLVVPFEDQGSEYPLFITWNIYPSSSLGKLVKSTPRLRGCIGCFEPLPIVEGLADYAKTSAFKDRRFSPITESELPRLECGVSLLTDFEECQDYLDWEVGTHGIYIHLPNPQLASQTDGGLGLANDGTPSSSSASSSGSSTPAASAPRKWLRSSGSERPFLTATYLPDVMPAQGWTKVEAIDSAIRKAGWDGRITESTRKSLRVRRYQSAKCTRTYDEWMEWRSGAERA